MPKKMTYAKAGVSIDSANSLIKSISQMTKTTHRKGTIGKIGGFGGLFKIPSSYKNPVLVSGTDGVGTKLLVAKSQNNHKTIGIDLVAMCVNDLIVCGAEPLFFLDYYATGKLNLQQSKEIISGIAKGCKESNASLIGGETAEMPDCYKGDDYDLAGFAVGVVEEKKIIDGKKVRAGDIVIGLHSSGVHSNGLSLARKVFSKKDLSGNWGKKLLVPTRIYVKPVLALAKKGFLKALSHITGGGFYENIPRSLPKNKDVVIDSKSWKVPSLFREIQKRGNIDEEEMFTTFNMGIGMTLIISEKNVKKAETYLKKAKVAYSKIGFVKSGSGKVVMI